MTTDGTLHEKLARIESELAIRNLVAGYAIAVDTRDMAKLASMYLPGINEAEAARLAGRLRLYYRTFHMVMGQVVEFTSASTATGQVYTLAHHEMGERWMAMAICYADQYVLHEGTWLFARQRQLRKLYNADLERGPMGPYDRMPYSGAPDPRVTWPAVAPTWQAFWDAVPLEERRELTRFP